MPARMCDPPSSIRTRLARNDECASQIVTMGFLGRSFHQMPAGANLLVLFWWGRHAGNSQ